MPQRNVSAIIYCSLHGPSLLYFLGINIIFLFNSIADENLQNVKNNQNVLKLKIDYLFESIFNVLEMIHPG